MQYENSETIGNEGCPDNLVVFQLGCCQGARIFQTGPPSDRCEHLQCDTGQSLARGHDMKCHISWIEDDEEYSTFTTLFCFCFCV